MSLNTRITEFFGIELPILLAPMAMISGGRLAAAVARDRLCGGVVGKHRCSRSHKPLGKPAVGAAHVVPVVVQPHLRPRGCPVRAG